MKKRLYALALMSSSLSSYSFSEQPSFNYIEVKDTQWEQYDGYKIEGSYEINDWLYIGGSYSEIEARRKYWFSPRGIYEFIDKKKITEVKVGGKYAINPNTVLFGEVFYQDIRNSPHTYYDVSYDWGASIGLRSMIRENIEAYSKITDFHRSNLQDLTYTLGGRVFFTDELSLFAEYNIDNDGDEGHSIGVSYHFK